MISTNGKSLSVIIPTYKRDDLLLGLVKKLVCEQTEVPEEVIIIYSVDDESGNNYIEILGKLNNISPNKNTNIVFKDVNNTLTLNAKRNIGLACASGDYILFFDDDNDIDNEFICKLKFLHQTYDAVSGLTFEKGINITENRVISYDIIKNTLRHKWGNGDSYTLAVNSGFISIKNEWFSKNGLLDDNYVYSFDDYDLGWRLWQTNTIVFKSKDLFIDHLKAGGGSRSRFKGKKRNKMKIYSKSYFVSKHFGKKVAFYLLLIDLLENTIRTPFNLFLKLSILNAMLLNVRGLDSLSSKMKDYL